MDLAIYGAQGIALGACKAIRDLFPERRIRCFLVTKREENAEKLFGLAVMELETFAGSLSKEEKDKIEVLVATPESAMDDIEKALEEHGIHCHVRLTSSRWSKLVSFHYARGKRYMPLAALPPGFHKPRLHMFMAKFYKDKPLQSDFPLPGWVTPVQAGAALTKERVADVLDCSGENISVKNVNYSELTVLYWMWKNCFGQEHAYKESYGGMDYYGLSHYRRILEISQDDVLRLADNGVDVVLPHPMPYEPDIAAHHKRYLSDEDWKVLLMVLGEQQPEYSKALPGILSQQYFYNYNIILARREALDDYCKWLFPVLESVDRICNPEGKRRDRYLGYMGETLETLYFMHNRNKWNIVHAGCRFLV